MTSPSDLRDLRGSAGVLLPCAAAAAAAVVLVQRPGPALLAFTAAVALAVLAAMPAHWLPGIAVSVFVLVPVAYIPELVRLATFSPALAIMIVWAVRVARRPDAAGATKPRRLLLALGGWLVLSCLASIAVQQSVIWTLNLLVLVLLPAWLTGRADPRTMQALTRTWMLLTTIVGALAVVEYLQQTNVLFDGYYDLSRARPGRQIQTWSTYRVTTTLGHPLMNATFLAGGVAVAYSQMLAGQKRAVVPAALGMVALLLTVSRSGLVALGAAVTVSLMAGLFARGYRPGAKLASILLVGLGVAAALSSNLLTSRAATHEGLSSTLARSDALNAARTLIGQHGWLGSGPSTSTEVLARAQSLEAPTLENSYLQIVVSTGLVGLLLFVGLIAAIGWAAVRRRNLTGLTVLAAVCVAMAGFNLIESNPSALVLLGAAVTLCLQPAHERASA